MNKICTSLEQSKKLIELGLDVKTADMYYDVNSYGIQSKPEVVVGEVWSKDIPAWSLSALLKLLNRNYYNVSLNCYGAEWNIKFDDSERYKDFTKDYAIDSAFEMVCWLKENNKI